MFRNRIKYASVVPLFTKGCTDGVDNSHPISLNLVFSKIIYNRSIKFLNKHNTQSESQSDFRKGCSTEKNIYTLLEHLF